MGADVDEPFRILLIEDNDHFGKALVAMITREAHDVTPVHIDVATSLAQARERLRTRQYQSVLCDPGLPDSKGAATVAAVCELAKPQGAIVTVVTGGMQSEDEHSALKRVVGLVMKDTLRPGRVLETLYGEALESIEVLKPELVTDAIEAVVAARMMLRDLRLAKTDSGVR